VTLIGGLGNATFSYFSVDPPMPFPRTPAGLSAFPRLHLISSACLHQFTTHRLKNVVRSRCRGNFTPSTNRQVFMPQLVLLALVPAFNIISQSQDTPDVPPTLRDIGQIWVRERSPSHRRSSPNPRPVQRQNERAAALAFTRSPSQQLDIGTKRPPTTPRLHGEHGLG